MTTVLQIIPSLGSGGAEQATVDVAAALVAAGHRALVMSSGGRLVSQIEAVGAEHITRPVHSKNPLRMLWNAWKLSRFVHQEKVQILHARSRAPAWVGLWASHLTGCSFVTTFHAAYKFDNAFKKYYNSVMTKGDRVIAISEFIATHIRENYKMQDDVLRIIPRSIDLEKFSPAFITPERQAALRKAWGVGVDGQIILLPARLSPIKGHKTLIKAMAQLPKTMKVNVVIVGDDQGRVEYRRELENMINGAGLSGRVHIVAHCADMPAAYSLASLVVAPSLVAEGFGRVPIEAMAMGVPVIASDLGGHRETIRPVEGHGGYGWLFPVDDSVALTACIMQAMSLDPASRTALTERAMADMRARYDKSKMVADTLAVYEECTREIR